MIYDGSVWLSLCCVCVYAKMVSFISKSAYYYCCSTYRMHLQKKMEFFCSNLIFCYCCSRPAAGHILCIHRINLHFEFGSYGIVIFDGKKRTKKANIWIEN